MPGFAKEALGRRTACNGFFVPAPEDELIFRAREAAANPHKTRHAAYIREHADAWKAQAARQALEPGLWQRLPPDLRD